MSVSRIYQPGALGVDATIRLDDQASHHLARVLRASVGDQLIIFNGMGGEYQATIKHIDKKGVDVMLTHFSDRDVESPVNLYLAQGVARGEKMDFIVQKAVELGAKKIFPLITERGNVRLEGEREEKRLQHWQSVIISACEQSGRNLLPTISAPQTLTAFLQQTHADHAFVLSPHVRGKLAETKVQAGQSVLLLIGPEGGLSDNEVAMAIAKQFIPLNLGPRVLRTETATIAALSVLQCEYGDL